MAWNGSGTFQRTNGVYSGATVWTDDRNAGIPATASRFDTHDQDLAQGINNCLTKDGQNTPTANLPMAGFRHTNVGNAASNTDYMAFGQIRNGAPLFLDTTNNRLGVGTSSPRVRLQASGATPATTAFATNPGTIQIDEKGITNLTTNGGLEFQGSDTSNGYGSKIVGFDNGSLVFARRNDAAAWTESMRISNGGFVGINATPVTALHVNGASFVNSGTSLPALSTSVVSGEIHAGESNVLAADAGYVRLSAGGGTTLSAKNAIDVFRESGGTQGIIAYTAGAERLRIDGGGRTQIGGPVANADGTGTDQGQLYLYDNDTSTSALMLGYRFQSGVGEYGRIQARTNTGAANIIMQAGGGNVGIGAVTPSFLLHLATDSAAKPTTNTWTISSDGRIKTNIQPYAKGLAEICQVQPITYDYNGKGGIAAGPGGVSIIAQELQPIFPECVGSYRGKLNPDDEEETDILNYNGHAISFALINAVKELSSKLDALEARVTALEGA